MPQVRSLGQTGGHSVATWYYDTFSSVKLLTREEELALIEQCRVGHSLKDARWRLKEQLGRNPTFHEWAEDAGVDVPTLRRQLARATRATDHMVAANMRLVMSVVRPYATAAGGALSVEDLVQEGSIGLLKAVHRFEPERGLRFSTGATWWIRSAVQRAVANQSRMIRLPNCKFRLLSKAKRASLQLEQRHGRRPEEEELAEELRVSLRQLRGVTRHWHGCGSLEAPVRGAAIHQAGDRSATVLDSYNAKPMGQQRTLDAIVETDLVGEALRRQLHETLSPLESRVLRLRYGLDDGHRLSWSQISEECERPVAELQTTQCRALRRLRKNRELRQLEGFCHHAEWDSTPLS